MSTIDRTTIWVWRDDDWSDDRGNLDGFSVEAVDGSIGKIDEATYDVGGSYVVVDTGPWIFGKKVLLPAGVIDRIDYDDEVVYVNETKEQIKNSPEFDESTYRDDDYRSRVGDYYLSWDGGRVAPPRRAPRLHCPRCALGPKRRRPPTRLVDHLSGDARRH